MLHPALRFLFKPSALILSTFTLSACIPHLNQQQCLSMDWYQVGYSDGAGGNFQRDLNPAITDCAKFKLTVDTRKYQRGWRAGTRKFCVPTTAEQLGVNGQVYNSICPPDQSAAFESAWRRGLRRYCTPATGYNLGRSGAALPDFCATDQITPFRNAYGEGRRIFDAIQGLDADINAINEKIDRTSHQIHDQHRKIDELNARLQSNTLSPTERYTINQQIHDLSNSTLQLRDEIGHLESQRTRLQQQERDYQTR